jgi:hypothetical protein
MSCPICCENFTAAKRKAVKCPFCPGAACVECCQKYILDSGTVDAACMSCKTPWNREFLALNFTNAFISRDYKSHREQVLFEREYALLPASQHMVEHWRRAQTLREEIPGIKTRIAELKRELEDLTNRRNRFSNELHIIMTHEYRRGAAAGTGADTAERRKFIKACPAENCRGFLSTAWKCGTCDVRVCPDCHVIKVADEDHECNPADVATALLLSRDTKSCPSCATMITKIDGCDQMFCTQCHTAFSWRTGAIEKGTIHNPHFYEWQRRQNGGVAPRVPGDMPGGNNACAGGGLMPLYMIEINPIFKENPHDLKNALRRAHRLVSHTHNVTVPMYRNARVDNADLRLYYLVEGITEKEWKQKLQQREKKAMRNDEARQILEAFVEVGNIFFGDLFGQRATAAEVAKRFEDLIAYSNEALEKAEKLFGMKIAKISTN